MARQSKKQPWERSLQATAHWRGWGLSHHYGKVRLKLQFPPGAGIANASATLPYSWDPASIGPVQGILTRIYGPVMEGGVTLKAAIDDVLAISDHKAQEVVTPWPGIVSAFKDYKLTQGNRIAEATFKSSYQRYLDVALVHLQGRNAATTGKELTERVLTEQRFNKKPGKVYGQPLKKWIDQPKSRQECALALKKFTEFAVSRHRQPQCWLLSEEDYFELKGDGGTREPRAVLSDEEVMKVISLLPETWANVVKIIRIFGFRAWEHRVIVRRINEAGEPQLFVTEGKTHISRRGVKKKTPARWLVPIPLMGNTFNLVEEWETLKLPPTVNGKQLGNELRKLPYWRELMARAKAHGEELPPYSLRHSYSQLGEEAGVNKADLCHAMGHSEEVHNRQYTTSTAASVRRSFQKAFPETG